MRTSLAHFPAELLVLILPPSVSYLVVRLWKAGDRLLNSKLASVITEVELRAISDVDLPIPRMLHELRNLRRVCLSSSQRFFCDTSKWVNALRALPQGLESLEVAESDAFYNYAPQHTDRKPEYVYTEFSRGPSEFLDIGKLFPNLKTLKLEHDPMHTASPTFFPALPSTMTAFSIASPINYTLNSLRFLPESLQDLGMCLTFAFSRADFDDPPGVAKKPGFDRLSKLASVRFLHCRLTTDCRSLPEEVVDRAMWPSMLPEGLGELQLDDIPHVSPAFVAKLPRSLTALCLGLAFSNAWAKFFAEFRSSSENASVASNSIWPSGLTYLDIILPPLEEGILRALPRTLRKLKILVYADEANAHIFLANELPSGLTYLEMNMDTHHTVKGDFPASLTQLYAYGGGGFDCKSLARLPPSVKDLTLIYEDFAEYASYHLPSHVKSGYIEIWKDSSFASLAPNGLTSLKINRFTPCADLQQVFAFMPASLTELSIEHAMSAVELPELCLAPFTHLRSLNLHPNLVLPSSALRHLPSRDSMQTLDVALKIVNSDDLAFLPPNLICCNLKQLIDSPNFLFTPYWPVRSIATLPHFPKQPLIERLRLRFKDY